MSNYKIILDENVLRDFVSDFLPEITPDETFYCCLFARSKYAKNEDGSNKFPHIKTDKNQLKRFVSNKDMMFRKIKQLECEFGAYLTKDGDPIPQESLALYIAPNPRSQRRANFFLQRRLLDILEASGQGYNVQAEALSALQKSASRKPFVMFDIDDKEIDWSQLSTILPGNCYRVLETRGGFHFLILTDEIKKTEGIDKGWHPKLRAMFDVDISGDQMIPVPGTFQGGFTPRFVK